SQSARTMGVIRRRSIAGVFCVCVALITFAAGGALASSPSYARSIEAQAAEADVVVRARVIESVVADPPGMSGGHWRRVTVAVSETLKGPTSAKIDFYISSAPTASGERQQWLDSDKDAIFCLWAGARVGRLRRDLGCNALVLDP